MKPITFAAIVLIATACTSRRPADERRYDTETASAATREGALPATEQQPQTQPKKTPSPEPAPVGTTHKIVDGKVVNVDAEAIKDFKDRIAKYVQTHNTAIQKVPPLKQTTKPAEIKVAENALAAHIRAMRVAARPGDIFTPEIRDVFRRLLYPELKGEDGRESKEILKDDAPASVPLKVNTDYPEGAPLPTVPVNLLKSLPTLPEEVEYRIIGRTLILRDVKANMIVDFLPNVIR